MKKINKKLLISITCLVSCLVLGIVVFTSIKNVNSSNNKEQDIIAQVNDTVKTNSEITSQNATNSQMPKTYSDILKTSHTELGCSEEEYVASALKLVVKEKQEQVNEKSDKQKQNALRNINKAFNDSPTIFWKVENRKLTISGNETGEDWNSFVADENTLPGWFTNKEYRNKFQTVEIKESMKNVAPRSTMVWFGSINTPIEQGKSYEMSNITNIYGLQYLDVSNVQNASFMFVGTNKMKSFNQEYLVSANKLNFSNATDTSFMFTFSALNDDSINGVAKTLTKSKTYAYIFSKCNNLVNFNIDNVEYSSSEKSRYMFFACEKLETIAAGNLVGASTNNAWYMFACSAKLKTITLNAKTNKDWNNISSIGADNNIFYGCNSLTGCHGTTYENGNDNKVYAHVDKGSSSPGYFTGEDVETVKVTASVNKDQEGWGSIQGITEEGITVDSGTDYTISDNEITIGSIKITAIPSDPISQYTYGFDKWTPETNGTITVDTNFVASFTKTLNKVNIVASVADGQTDWGSVNIEGETTFDYGTTYTISDNEITIGDTKITATASDPTSQYTYSFEKWTPETNGTLTADTNFVASFKRVGNKAKITACADPAEEHQGWGSVSPNELEISCGSKIIYTMEGNNAIITFLDENSGEIIDKIIATPGHNTPHYTFTFDYWSITPDTVDGNIDYVAYFHQTENFFTITASVAEGQEDWGSVSLTPEKIENVPFGTSIEYNSSTITINSKDPSNPYVIKAVPKEDDVHFSYEFAYWDPHPASVQDNHNFVAHFRRIGKNATINASVAEGQGDWGSVSTEKLEIPFGSKISYTEQDNCSVIEFKDEFNERVIGQIIATPAERTSYSTFVFDHWNNTPDTVNDNIDYVAYFNQIMDTYIITASVEDGQNDWGSVSPEKIENVPYGSKITYSEDNSQITIKSSDGGIEYGTIKATPSEFTAEYAFAFDKWNETPETVEGDISFVASFTKTKRSYEVSLSTDGNGQITSDKEGSVEVGDIVKITVTPNEGYYFHCFEAKPDSIINSLKYEKSFIMPAEKVEIKALFTDYAKKLTLLSDMHGSLSSDHPEAYVVPGETIKLFDNPLSIAWVFDNWETDPESLVISSDNTFTMPDEDVTITVNHKKNIKSIKYDSKGEGKLSGDPEGWVGQRISLNVQPDDCCEIDKWETTPKDLKIDSDNTFIMPNEDVDIVAYFKHCSYRISHLAAINGSLSSDKTEGIPWGDTVQLSLSCDKDYQFDHFECTQEIDIDPNNRFIMPKYNIDEITAVFKYKGHFITLETDGKGTLSSDKDKAMTGDTVQLSVDANKGHIFDRFESTPSLTISSNNTFTMPDEDVTIKAYFSICPGWKSLNSCDVGYDYAPVFATNEVSYNDFHFGYATDGGIQEISPSVESGGRYYYKMHDVSQYYGNLFYKKGSTQTNDSHFYAIRSTGANWYDIWHESGEGWIDNNKAILHYPYANAIIDSPKRLDDEYYVGLNWYIDGSHLEKDPPCPDVHWASQADKTDYICTNAKFGYDDKVSDDDNISKQYMGIIWPSNWEYYTYILADSTCPYYSIDTRCWGFNPFHTDKWYTWKVWSKDVTQKWDDKNCHTYAVFSRQFS